MQALNDRLCELEASLEAEVATRTEAEAKLCAAQAHQTHAAKGRSMADEQAMAGKVQELQQQLEVMQDLREELQQSKLAHQVDAARFCSSCWSSLSRINVWDVSWIALHER